NVAVTAGDFIPLADITGGKLKFTPALNDNGTGYTTFTFQVQDDGGTTNGGLDLDQSPNTITVNVTAVNDPPVIGGAGNSVSYTEQAAAITLDGALTLSDVDNTTLAGATVKIASGRQSGDTLHFTDQNGITGNYV